jgi:hypothetical protein
MLFLMIFTVLGLSFYFAVTTSAQISANERTVSASQVAAESGMEFFRLHLGQLDVMPNVTPDKLLEEVYQQLRARLEGTGNLGTRLIGYDGKTISIPEGPSEFIRITSAGPSFRATITASGDQLVVKVIGSHSTTTSALSRAIQLDFNRVNRPTILFDYGVASKGKVQLKSGAATRVLGTPDADGSILSTFGGPGAITTGSGPIEGDLSVVGSKNDVTLGGGSVGGETVPGLIKANHIHVVAAPVFPVVDTTAFKSLATNVYVSGAATQKNIRVPPNTNPKFNGGDVINGILYIESPNQVTFRGNATINGIIVFENKGNASVNSLDFKGNVTPTTIPNTAEFAAVKAVAEGWSIAAPTAAVIMSGSVDGTLEGSMIASSVDLAGSADITFKTGSIIALGTIPTVLEGKTVTFAGTGADSLPVTGLRLNANFLPNPCSYREVAP